MFFVDTSPTDIVHCMPCMVINYPGLCFHNILYYTILRYATRAINMLVIMKVMQILIINKIHLMAIAFTAA